MKSRMLTVLVLAACLQASPHAARSQSLFPVEQETGTSGPAAQLLLDYRAAAGFDFSGGSPSFESFAVAGIEAGGGESGKAKVTGRIELTGETVQADLEEAVIDLYLGPTDWQIGRQRLLWGRADGMNPTGRFHQPDPLAFSLEPADMYLPEWMVRGRWFLPCGALEGVWNPEYRFTDIPEGATPPIPIPETPERAQIGIKLDIQRAGWEGSVCFINGPDSSLPAPLISLAGADFSTAFGSTGLRGEAAFSWPEGDPGDPAVPSAELSAAAGFDGSLGNHITWMLQMNGKYIPLWEEDPPSPYSLLYSQEHQWQTGSMARLGITLLNDDLEIELSGAAGWTSEEYLVFMRSSWRPAGTTEIYLIVRIGRGGEGSRTALFEEFLNGARLGVRSEW